MYEVKEVHHYDDSASTGNSMVAIFAIVLLALIGIALLVWQPWAASTPSSTTVIHETGSSTPTIVNPPANNTTINPPAQTAPAPTNVNVTVPPASTSNGGGSNSSGPDTSNGGDGTGPN